MKRLARLALPAAILISTAAMAQENRIDRTRPDAPALAAFGDTAIGVRTIELSNPGQIDIVNVGEEGELPRYDRPLTVEVWYPAAEGAETPDGPAYRVFLRDGKTEVDIHGRAIRDAAPAAVDAPLPVVLISHGYPGNRFLLSHLAENLASKGYVVASIDHTDSTYNDQTRFGSTLVNRTLDQLFVLDEIERMSGSVESFLNGVADASNTGLIGYSMGGYGAVITSGGGVTKAATELAWGAPRGTLEVHLAGSDSHEALMDERIKATIAIAPWGMEYGFWDAAGLAGVRKPIMYVAGSVDDVSGYEKGVKAMYEASVNTERYLLTFENANHNAAAPMPAPAESWEPVDNLDFVPFEHYADAVWDTVRMNNITQHFATAFLGKHLMGDSGMDAYLDLIENAGDGVHALNEDGTEKPEHSLLEGFRQPHRQGPVADAGPAVTGPGGYDRCRPADIARRRQAKSLPAGARDRLIPPLVRTIGHGEAYRGRRRAADKFFRVYLSTHWNHWIIEFDATDFIQWTGATLHAPPKKLRHKARDSTFATLKHRNSAICRRKDFQFLGENENAGRRARVAEGCRRARNDSRPSAIARALRGETA